MSKKRTRRERRTFSAEYKAEIVALIRSTGESPGSLCKRLDLTESTVRKWIDKSEKGGPMGTAKGVPVSESEELKQLRAEVKQLRTERDILKKATAFFAKDSM